MGEYPSREHQFVGGERFGKPRPPIGKRRAKALNKQAAIMAAAFGPEPEYTGSNRDWLLEVRSGRIVPSAAQIAAAVVLQRYGEAADAPKRSIDLSGFTADQRGLLALLLGKALGEVPTIEMAALPAPATTSHDRVPSGSATSDIDIACSDTALSPADRAEREALHREAEAIMTADELAALRREFPLD